VVWRSQSLSTASAASRRDRFEQFARQHVDQTYRLAIVILGNASDAEDVTHDALLRAWQHWPELRDETRFDAWFQRILVNECAIACGISGGVRFA
jgi:DNA-directed RNA polymerase specialized sigma24 family protein